MSTESLEFLRGIIEKIIDEQLRDHELAMTHQLFESWKPIIKNREDAVFNYIVGYVNRSAEMLFIAVLQRLATQEEMSEVAKSVKNNRARIKSRITETMT